MKIIASYLPQFHRIFQNDRWWGKGYTEWTATQRGRPLFETHYQPRSPLHAYYYDLTNASARRWQARLAQRYGVHGFCYYHYWFKGKRLLEKPFDAVLSTGQPDFPFCLFWTNHDWVRPLGRAVLLRQEYGGEDDWNEHFAYLFRAFNNRRYIRVEGKPLFVLYAPSHIPRCEQMLAYWRARARERGLPGIYIVASLLENAGPTKVRGIDASVEMEPMYTVNQDSDGRYLMRRIGPDVKVVNYDRVWAAILDRPPRRRNGAIIPGAFPDWDDTARRKHHATVFVGANPDRFERYLTQQLERARTEYDSEFVFINAWNEWSEAAYLEPDARYGYAYLEAVESAL